MSLAPTPPNHLPNARNRSHISTLTPLPRTQIANLENDRRNLENQKQSLQQEVRMDKYSDNAATTNPTPFPHLFALGRSSAFKTFSSSSTVSTLLPSPATTTTLTTTPPPPASTATTSCRRRWCRTIHLLPPQTASSSTARTMAAAVTTNRTTTRINSTRANRHLLKTSRYRRMFPSP